MLFCCQKPRNKLIHEQPSGTIKTACNYEYIKSIWPEFTWYIEGGDYYIGVQTKEVVLIIVVSVFIQLWREAGSS